MLDINSKSRVRIPNSVLEIIQEGIKDIPVKGVPPIPFDQITPLLPYPVPPKIWCIGLNYKSHAEDIDAVQPEEPGSFMKPASCMFEPGGTITLPPEHLTNDVDAEGELGVVIGKTSRFLTQETVAERDLWVHDNARPDRSRCAEEESALSYAREKLRHLFQLWASDCNR